MNKGLLVLVAALVLAYPAYKIAFRSATHTTHSMLQTSDGEMEWLRKEFGLGNEQFDRIRALHAEYQPKCMEYCGRVTAANEKLERLAHGSKTVTPEIAQALNEAMAVQEECRRAMLGHIYAVSAEMSPESGHRYVSMMLPRIIQPPLSGENVSMDHSQHAK